MPHTVNENCFERLLRITGTIALLVHREAKLHTSQQIVKFFVICNGTQLRNVHFLWYHSSFSFFSTTHIILPQFQESFLIYFASKVNYCPKCSAFYCYENTLSYDFSFVRISQSFPQSGQHNSTILHSAMGSFRLWPLMLLPAEFFSAYTANAPIVLSVSCFCNSSLNNYIRATYRILLLFLPSKTLYHHRNNNF